MNSAIKEYNQYIKTPLCNDSAKSFDRYEVFFKIAKRFSIKKALYPGSYIHITPSLIIPEVIYVDNVKKAKEFFYNEDEIIEFIEANKIYSEKSKVKFEPMDYWKKLSIIDEYVDLLISQYAGFVSEACKRYLRIGGILLVGDSHGDATLAKLDNDFKLIGVLEYNGDEYEFLNDDLEKYFRFKRERPIDKEKLKSSMKGPKYKYMAEYYLFEKVV
jgi:hypothetical protein